MVLAVLNIVGIWVSMPVLNATFGFLNMTLIVSLIPLLKQELKNRKKTNIVEVGTVEKPVKTPRTKKTK